MELNDKIIAALETKGFKRWTKGNMDRLYIDATNLIDLELDYNKSGNVTWAVLNGERISNTRGREYKATKTYIDIATGIVYSIKDGIGRPTNEELRDAAQEILDQTIEEIETEADEGTNEIDDSNDASLNLSNMSDQIIVMYSQEQHQRLTQKNSNGYFKHLNITDEERESILKTLHSIRMETWRRNTIVPAPTEAERDLYVQRLQKNRERLERAIESGQPERIYAMKNKIMENEDAIAWINK